MGFITKDKIYNFSIYGFGQAVNLISPLLVIPYIVSVCGESGLGKVGVGFSFALISIVLVDAGSYINGTKEVSIHNLDREILEEKFTTIYLAKLLLLLGVLLVCSLLIFVVPFLARDKEQFLLSLLIVIGQFINPTWFFQGLQNFKWISLINVLSKGLYVLAVFALVSKPGDYIFVNAYLGIGSIVAGLLGFLQIYRKYQFRWRRNSLQRALNLIKSEWTLSVSQLFFSFYQYAPIIVISYLCGNFMAGQYRIIDQIVMIFRTYLQIFFNFIYAEICLKIYGNLKNGLTEWKKYNLYSTMLILAMLLFFYIFSAQILAYFKVAPDQMQTLQGYLRIGLAVPLFMSVTFALKQLMFAFDKNKPYIKITIASSVLHIALTAVLLPVVGLLGAFLSAIILELLIAMVYVWVLKGKIFQPHN